MSNKPDWWNGDEWATPWSVVNQWGHFDLDPCATAENAKAPYYFTKNDDGLVKEWFERVFLNPPYSNPGPWVKKAVEERKAGRVVQVVALLPSATDTRWFHEWVLPYAGLIWIRGRIRFLGWEGKPIGSPRQTNFWAVY